MMLLPPEMIDRKKRQEKEFEPLQIPLYPPSPFSYEDNLQREPEENTARVIVIDLA